MKLVVFGANGPTGRLLTRLALDEGHEVALGVPFAKSEINVYSGGVSNIIGAMDAAVVSAALGLE